MNEFTSEINIKLFKIIIYHFINRIMNFERLTPTNSIYFVLLRQFVLDIYLSELFDFDCNTVQTDEKILCNVTRGRY